MKSLKFYLVTVFFCFAVLYGQVKEETPALEKLKSSENVNEALSKLEPTEETIKALTDVVENGHAMAKAKAIETLIRFETEDSYPVFKEYLNYGTLIDTKNKKSQHISWLIRANSAVGLGRLKKKEALPALHKGIKRERDDTVKKSILYALGEIGDPESVPIVLNEIEVSEDESLILEAVIALGKIGDKSCFKPLLEISTGHYIPIVKEEAAKALNAIKWSEEQKK